ncbi:N-terminal phage integrase SAM-like domain-containing protein [Streptomyces sp. NPDC007851]|uniref:N-terminal phage integrase SAM-like domain-containing protein n=1 Tax=Streptomyces sp. NPDC007851 TaxID=3155008 RepID=UPI0033EC156E
MPKGRANGEGTITSRADGRYQAAAYVYRPDGTRTRKFVYGKTRPEVADKLTELLEKTRQGIPAAESTMAFGDYLTYWLATIASQRLKPSTLNSYEGLTRLYIRPALGKKRLNRLSPADVRRFLSEFKVVCTHVIGLRCTRFIWPHQVFDCGTGRGFGHRRSQREEAVRGRGERSATGSRVGPKDLGTVVPIQVRTDREVFEVSTHRHRSPVGSPSCRTRPAARSGRVGIHAHRHP